MEQQHVIDLSLYEDGALTKADKEGFPLVIRLETVGGGGVGWGGGCCSPRQSERVSQGGTWNPPGGDALALLAEMQRELKGGA